jgi:prophage regulatory protein
MQRSRHDGVPAHKKFCPERSRDGKIFKQTGVNTMPDTKPDLVRRPVVAVRFAFPSVEALDQAVRRGKFPKPIKTGKRAVAWREVDLQAWLAARVAERDGEAVAA